MEEGSFTYLISRTIETVPTTALALDISLGLAAFTGKAADGFRWFRMQQLELYLWNVDNKTICVSRCTPVGECALTGHVQSQLTLVILAHLDPTILTRHRLLKVDDVVASGSVAIAVEAKIISAEACTIKKKEKTKCSGG